MNQIGYKNFRKFHELPPLDLSPVTIFVGENNAGKSTVVKALLATLDFIKSRVSSVENDAWMNLNFYFNKSYYTHLGTFERARYNKAAENEPITFIISTGDRRYEIDVEKSDSDADVFGRVSRIKITLLPFNIELCFSLRSDRKIHIVFHSHPFPGYNLDEIPAGYPPKFPRDLEKYFNEMSKDIEMEMTLVEGVYFSSEYIADALLQSFQIRLGATIENLNSKSSTQNNLGVFGLTDEIKDFLCEKKTIFSRKYFRQIKQSDINVEYIYAHAVTQTILFSAKDTNDYHVKTVHEYANLQVGEGSPSHDFILKWMQAFNIGKDYKITSVGGEAHLVKIQNFDGEWVNLADKGMGSIQLMILLFRVATKMAEAGIGYGTKKVDFLLIIEEPEQNLHPMLQSKLADLFYELNQEYGFRFIIETHSEYLIRKSQVIVGKSNKNDGPFNNPFRVYYFPSEGEPYDLPYAKSGRFEEQFGTGFFDEASKWNREILRNENSR